MSELFLVSTSWLVKFVNGVNVNLTPHPLAYIPFILPMVISNSSILHPHMTMLECSYAHGKYYSLLPLIYFFLPPLFLYEAYLTSSATKKDILTFFKRKPVM